MSIPKHYSLSCELSVVLSMGRHVETDSIRWTCFIGHLHHYQRCRCECLPRVFICHVPTTFQTVIVNWYNVTELHLQTPHARSAQLKCCISCSLWTSFLRSKHRTHQTVSVIGEDRDDGRSFIICIIHHILGSDREENSGIYLPLILVPNWNRRMKETYQIFGMLLAVHHEPRSLIRLFWIGPAILWLRLKFLTPTFCKSSSAESSHLIAGLPTRGASSHLCTVNFLQGFCACILSRCRGHLNRPTLINVGI
jgi:hypothetical protein